MKSLPTHVANKYLGNSELLVSRLGVVIVPWSTGAPALSGSWESLTKLEATKGLRAPHCSHSDECCNATTSTVTQYPKT